MTNAKTVELKIDRQSLIKSIITLFTGSAGAQVMVTIALLLTARMLGPAQYGQYAGSMLLAMFLSILFNLGMDIWLLREGGIQPNNISTVAGSVLSIKFLFGFIWLGFMIILAPIIQTNAMPANLIRLAALAAWLSSLFTTCLTAFKAVLKNKVSAFLEAGAGAGRLILTILLVMLGIDRASTYILVIVIVSAIGIPIALWLLWISFGLQAKRQMMVFALKSSPPYAASDFLVWAFMRMDALIVAFFLGATATGVYSLGEGILNIAFLVPAAIQVVIIPVLSLLFVSDTSQFWKTARRTTVLLLIIGVVLTAGLFVGSNVVVLLIGSAYTKTVEVIKILSPIALLHSINFATVAIIVATGEQLKRTIVQAIAVVFNLVMNLLLIQITGINGTAWIYVLTELLLFLGYGFVVVRYRRMTIRRDALSTTHIISE